ncbi:MAG: NirA family protein [Verrucomicrobiales bacterium]|nr:NirA family protein [Verrucomicrobiales bacterium]
MKTESLGLTQVAGEKLNAQQTAYLDGFFAGLKNRGFAFAGVDGPTEATAAQGKVSQASLEDLTAEERIKRELHPLDAYPLLLQHAAANQAPDKENTYRFKWHGLFYLSPAKDAFMARLRIPGGELKTFQLRELARIAQDLTTGYVQITTRANLQVRHIQPKDAPELLRRIQLIGLHTRGAGADNVRNLTCDATSGLDPQELIETLPLVHEMAQVILNTREFYDLPRKFNIAFYGGGSIPTVEETNDIGWSAVRLDEAREGRPAGIYFRCAVGGATGHKAIARDLGIVVQAADLIRVTSAMLKVYVAHGNRTDRKRARLKHLLETWSLDQFLTATEELLGFPLLKEPLKPAIASTAPARSHPHVGVYPQKQDGLSWVGISVPVGQISPKQLLRLADLADHYGSGEVRLTVWQNIILPNVPAAYLETVKKALVKMGLGWQQSNLRTGFIACTGNSHCKFASSNTKRDALELMEALDREVVLDQPINVHLTGCPNSCAQHYIGDIGLLGTKVKVEGESKEGYHVFVGGGFGGQPQIGRQLFSGVSVGMLKPLMTQIILGYLKHRLPSESFQAFASRHDIGQLQVLLAES